MEIIKPKMILFDYGGTLMYGPDFCPSAGNAVIYSYISENPHNISLQIQKDEQEYGLKVLGAIYHLETGKVEFL